jgi:homopolymeric O-antigen transport system permease protein
MSVEERSRVPVMVAPQAGDELAPPAVVIKPSRGWISLGLRDLWIYRELFYFLAWRDVKVRYKQTVIGVVWVVLQPILMILTFTLIFGRAAGLSSEGFPYSVFMFSALLPWTLFATALTQSSMSIVVNQQVVKKVYFPRLVIPIAATLASVVDFVVGAFVLVGLMAYYHMVPTPWIVITPLLIVLALATAVAVGLWLAALNAKYRDVQYTIPFLIQIWFFLTPIVYSTGILPGRLTFVYGLNPMVGVVQGFRWALLGSAPHIGGLMIVAVVMVTVLLLTGLEFFRRTERIFVDLV